MITYEQQLHRDTPWAFHEGSLHFEKASAVHKTLVRVVRRLDDLARPYAIVGAMAMFFHGYRRFTEDVDILVTPEDLRTIHERLEGLGYVPLVQGSQHLRDAESGVRIKFFTTGSFPDDGKTLVAFPDPRNATVEMDGIRFLSLPKLIELKLAAGLSSPKRLQGLADVQNLIKQLHLPADLVEQVNPSVRDKFRELWTYAQELDEDSAK